MAVKDIPRFPTNISFDSLHRPAYSTSIVRVFSGRVQRNINWSEGLHSYDLGYGVRTQKQLYTVLEYFHALKGPGHGFPVKDPNDYKSKGPFDLVSPTDQLLGTGDGIKARFKLIKTYTVGNQSTQRVIAIPVVSTIQVAVNDVETALFSFDTTTFEIVLDTAAPAGETVKAGYEFNVPVFISEDNLEISYVAWEKGELRIPVQELRPEDSL